MCDYRVHGIPSRENSVSVSVIIGLDSIRPDTFLSTTSGVSRMPAAKSISGTDGTGTGCCHNSSDVSMLSLQLLVNGIVLPDKLGLTEIPVPLPYFTYFWKKQTSDQTLPVSNIGYIPTYTEQCFVPEPIPNLCNPCNLAFRYPIVNRSLLPLSNLTWTLLINI